MAAATFSVAPARPAGIAAARAPATRASHAARSSIAAPCSLSCRRATFATGSAHLIKAASRSQAKVGRRSAIGVVAEQMWKEEKSGLEFPLLINEGGVEYRCLGGGVRNKKVALIPVKVYAVTLYAEPEPAAKELGLRERGGFFKNDPEASMADALMDGAFQKCLSIQMCRKVEGAQFTEALEEILKPRMVIMGETSAMEAFKGAFEGKTLDKGTGIKLNWSLAGDLNVSVDGAQVLNLQSPGLCRAIFEIYLGSATIVPKAKTSITDGAFKLLDSENVKRSTRKGGSG